MILIFKSTEGSRPSSHIRVCDCVCFLLARTCARAHAHTRALMRLAALLRTRWVEGFCCWPRPVEPDSKLAGVHSGRPCCAPRLTWPQSEWLHFSFLRFYVYMLLGDFKVPQKEERKKTKQQNLKGWFRLCLWRCFEPHPCGDEAARGDGAPRQGPIRNRWMGWWPPPPLEQQRNCHSKSQHVGLVPECRFVCQEMMGWAGGAMLWLWGSPWYEWLTLLQHLFCGKVSLFLTNDLPDCSLPFCPPVDESQTIFLFYSKAERNGEITLGQNKILHLRCGSLQDSVPLLTEEAADWCLYPSLLLPPSLPPSPPPPLSWCSGYSLSIRGEGEQEVGLLWSMAGNQTMGWEDVK